MTRADGPSNPPPNWVNWLGTGITSMLAVLFLVLVHQVRGQNDQIQSLQRRLEGLENARALERTSALEGQVQTSASRLQALESLPSDVQRLAAQQQRLQTTIDQLRGSGPPPPLPGLPPAMTPTPDTPARP